MPMEAVDLTLGMAGMQCADYTTEVEAVVNAALATAIDGADEDDFGDHECTDVSRRRGLLTASISVTTTVTVDRSTYDDATPVAAAVSATVAAAALSGSLTSSIITEAANQGLSSTIALTVTNAAAASAERTPTSTPTVLSNPLPTTALPTPSFTILGGISAANRALGGVASVVVVVLVVSSHLLCSIR